ncbi:zinc finger BED domain-containing protein 1-like isoform X1 [Fundulus heteroclitus]|uniref:zinc finger BED domain-containing protein 1-like isoform X1 n=2 Tax=Fundulus heteroclitus TaxID=8078 RepID=UPI00165B1BCE|nr:zinc finger BED domain-containing protein 1-like isoform X1 [Fundulus heteroclitus]
METQEAEVLNPWSQQTETATPATQDEALLPKRGGTSVVWLHFGFKKSDTEQTTVICKLCYKTVPSPDGNTTNLFYHLKKNHEKEYIRIQKVRGKASCETAGGSCKNKNHSQPKITESLSRCTPYEKTSQRHKQITVAIAHYICKGMVPVYEVEKESFRELVKVLDPRYVMPSRKHFSQVELPRLYDACRAKVEREVCSVGHFALTTDLWTSRVTQPYMSVTIHFISEDWTLCARCLQTAYFPDDHTGAMLAQGLRDALESWGLQECHLVCVTTDNATNNITAMELNEWQRLQCFGHRLQLAIENALKALTPASTKQAVERAVGVCKKVVSAFSNSWKRKRDLAKAQAVLGLPPHQLITETPTRWGSRQQMIQRFLEQEKALSQVLLADKKARNLVPSWQDMMVLESMNKALGPLFEFIDALSGEKYVTVSFLKPVLHLFNNEILSQKDGDTELSKAIKEGILKYLNEKYDDCTTNNLLDMATFVDPRFKTAYMKEERVEFIKMRAAAELVDMATPAPENAETATFISPPAAEDNPDLPYPTKKTKKSLGSYFKKAPAAGQGTSRSQSSRASIELELSMYLQTPGPDSEADPLVWWKQHELNFPLVARLAKKYLCIPATSSSSERAFSVSGNIVTCKRSCLKPNTVDQLVFLALNL